VWHARLVVGYKDSSTLELQGSGVGGVSELVSHLKDTEVQFALLRLPIVSHHDVDPSKSMISRFVLNACGLASCLPASIGGLLA
jgi:hypothetical protein